MAQSAGLSHACVHQSLRHHGYFGGVGGDGAGLVVVREGGGGSVGGPAGTVGDGDAGEVLF